MQSNGGESYCDDPGAAGGHQGDGAGDTGRAGVTTLASSEAAAANWPPSTFLGRLSELDRHQLLTIGGPTDFAPGQRIIREGEKASDVFVLLNGYVKVTSDTEHGETALLAVRIAGDVIGEMSAIDGGPRSASATACSAVVARVVDRRGFQLFLQDRPAAALAVSRMISERLRWANTRRVEIMTMGPQDRIRRILADVARIYRRPAAGTGLEVPLTQRELASLAGLGLRTVEKELKRLEASGLISRRYGRTDVFDLHRLLDP